MFSTIAIASTFIGLAASAPVARSEAKEAVSVPTYTATHFKTAHYEGSCGWTNRTNQYIASIATNSSSDKANEYCGQTINITSTVTGESVLAQVVDECKDCPASYLNLSRVAFEVIYPTTKANFTATYTFVDGENAFDMPASPSAASSAKSTPQPTSAADKYDDEEEQETSSTSSSATSTSSEKAEYTPSSSSASSSSKSTPTSASKKAEYTPSSSSSSSYKYTTASSSSDDEPAYTPSSSSKKEQEAAYTPTSSSSKYTPPAYTPSSSSQAPAYTPKAQSSGQYQGTATYFFQNGNPGACGNYNNDGAYIVALASPIYGNGGYCGQSVTLTNLNTGKSMTAQVADQCPSCGSTGIDLSEGLFNALGAGADGVFPVSYSIN